jgi:hypothetical protein
VPTAARGATAGEDGTVGVESLAGDLESEFVESAEGGQISAGDARADGADGSGTSRSSGWAA